MAETSTSVTLKALNRELLKQYTTYVANGNGVGLPEYVYQAPKDTADGGVCLVTQYSYNASHKPFKMQESLGTWDSTYDI